MKGRAVLVVDDQPEVARALVRLLRTEGIEAESVSDALEALRIAEERSFDAVLSDVCMPGMDGLKLLGRLREVAPSTPVILMTGFATIDSAVEAMSAGAFHYVSKPIRHDELRVVLDRAFSHRSLEQENRLLRLVADRSEGFAGLVGRSAAMRELFSAIRKIASSRASVLVTGESGTGKELVARAIHSAGDRAHQPFVPVNCAAIPEGVLESELFGHVRGAFTGATQSRPGLFERAAGGTLFLDEIGDMAPGLQSKLLRALQDGEIRPVGGSDTRHVNVRVIAATNANLAERMESGRFRSDLYYRLNVISLRIPPLRERPEDIPLLAETFVRNFGADRGLVLSPEAIDRLCAYDWPGNVRELENVIEHATVLAEGREIGPRDLPIPNGADGLEPKPTSGFLGEAIARGLTLRALEDLYIREMLVATGGNKVRAAELLGVHPRTLHRRNPRD